MVSWVISGVALLLAVLALAMVRRLARQFRTLTSSYWELRYDYTRLRSRLARLDPGDEPEPAGNDAPAAAAPPAPTVSYVPLSTIRKKQK